MIVKEERENSFCFLHLRTAHVIIEWHNEK
jgi:hypothetical protein